MAFAKVAHGRTRQIEIFGQPGAALEKAQSGALTRWKIRKSGMFRAKKASQDVQSPKPSHYLTQPLAAIAPICVCAQKCPPLIHFPEG